MWSARSAAPVDSDVLLPVNMTCWHEICRTQLWSVVIICCFGERSAGGRLSLSPLLPCSPCSAPPLPRSSPGAGGSASRPADRSLPRRPSPRPVSGGWRAPRRGNAGCRGQAQGLRHACGPVRPGDFQQHDRHPVKKCHAAGALCRIMQQSGLHQSRLVVTRCAQRSQDVQAVALIVARHGVEQRPGALRQPRSGFSPFIRCQGPDGCAERAARIGAPDKWRGAARPLPLHPKQQTHDRVHPAAEDSAHNIEPG